MAEAPLTTAEMEELKQLEAELAPSADLSQAEQDELKQLEAELEPATVQATAPVEEPDSMIESGARGLVQGATFGLAPDISAAIESTLGSMGIVDDKTFRQAKEESERAFKKAEKENPGTFTAGEIAGAVAGLATAIGGASKLASAAPALVKSANLTRIYQGVKALAKPGQAGYQAVAQRVGVSPTTVETIAKFIGADMALDQIKNIFK